MASKLTRSTTDHLIAGVCGGIAKTYDMDPSIIRIIAVVSLFCGSLGFWAYIIAWIILPKEQ